MQFLRQVERFPSAICSASTDAMISTVCSEFGIVRDGDIGIATVQDENNIYIFQSWIVVLPQMEKTHLKRTLCSIYM